MANQGKDGKFLPGNTAGVGYGRPRRAFEEGLLGRLVNVVDGKDWEAMVKALVKEAKRGNVSAFKALAAYGIGLPTQYVKGEMSSAPVSLEEWEGRVNDRVQQVEELDDDLG